MKVRAQFPDKLRPLFWPKRYKVARGGRSGGKSWGFARALLLMGIEKPLRILCAREVQKSIEDSVYKLLKDQIAKLELGSVYDVQSKKILGPGGTEFLFTGLLEHTVTTIKSFEAVDICWVEEGQAVSKRSWNILIPTIRKSGSEIWVSYNPDLETDDTHQRFTIYPPDDCINIEINWRDNPWHNDVMEQERRHCKKTDPDNYPNIWEGKCRPAVEGAIYFKQIQQVEDQRRIQNLPYDPMLKVHLVFDLGWNDSLACGLVQKNISEIRIIEYMEASHTDLNAFSTELKTRPYNWGKVWLPHDGFSGRLESGGKSTYDIMKAQGWNCPPREEIIELSKEEGIKATRLAFPRMYFDKTKCHAGPNESPQAVTADFHQTPLHNRLIECLKRYRRHVNQQTQATTGPVHDDYAHGADMLRYIACNESLMTNEDDGEIYVPHVVYEPLDAAVGY